MTSFSKLAIAVKSAVVLGAVAHTGASWAAEEGGQNQEVERIQVTGSKIKRIGELSPTPVTVISGDNLVDAGITNVADLLSEMPNSTVGLSPETTNNSVFANGLNNTDLRGLGTERTLVLVNGRRFVAGAPGSSAVDLNNIATSMIARVEISTGGASAVYGSDAVAGVVNIITKKSFDGMEIDASTSQPTQDGGESYYTSLTFGDEGENSSFIANITYTKNEQLRGDQRDFIRNGVISLDHPDNVDNEDGIPGRTTLDREGSTSLFIYSKNGDFFANDGGHYAFGDDGSIRPFAAEGFLPASSTPGSRNTQYYTGEGDGYSFLEHKYVRTPLERLNASINVNYDLAEDHSMAFEMTYSNTSAYGESSPAFFYLGGNSTDNAFFDDQTKQFFADQGMDTFNAYYLADLFGHRQYDQKRSLIRGALSFEGIINDDWSYDAYITKGHVQSDTTWYGELFEQRFRDAIDAVEIDGNIVCAERNADGEVIGAKAGCSPLNIWGKGLASQEALDYVGTDATRRASIDQTVIAGTVSGYMFELPAGPLAAAFSAEYREEKSSTLPDPAMREGLIFNNQSDALKGEFDVTELAAEFSVPVVVDTFFADEVYFELAYRYMDYSSTGTDNAWKVGFNYVLNDELRFRINRSKSVRAPSISELYQPAAQTFASFDDPCEQGEIDNAGEYRENIERNCRAAGIPEGWAPSNLWKSTNHPGFVVGNTELDNETANDWTIGFIYTPEFVEDLSITVDYWEFDIEEMIVSPEALTVVNGCYEFESLDNPYCDLIERNPETLEIDNFYQKPVNAATSFIAGTDVEINYGLDTSFGQFNFRLVSTYLDERTQNNTGKAEDERSYQGEYHRPRWKARFMTNYYWEDLTVALAANYRHATVLDREWTSEDNDYNDVPSYTEWDLTARYQVLDNLEVRGGVLNVFDRTPPRNPVLYDDGEFYDLDGRTLTVGFNYKF
ncbi:TonB-dependent receptor domain-containing protein [Pseudoalteromonas ruthenica]|uniref:TonB-dependent receptor domain-containing protein n=1 Tax=Pseudoalteromonas ruthenica TaxID=151081 RepID=UPI00241DBC9B|nr:TonB-dependent receptor [Pseudoalteromonas ruthenica]|tara:strand:- start:83317 stop:86187 length:2871 start_codon:yes stop_codon:yes gene_type:complete